MKRIGKIIIVIIVSFAFFSSLVNAQSTDRDYVRMGNREYRKSNFEGALTYYSKALEKKKTVEAFYNFANSALLQGRDSTAVSNYMQADSLGYTNPLKRAKNFHNLGNVWYMYGVQQLRSNGKEAGKAFENAVNLYKSSLRCNPKDDETRYNLAMAQYQLKKNKNGGGGGGNGDDKNKDKEQQDKKLQEQQNQQNQQDKQKQNQQNQEEKKDQMSDEAAEQLLNSAQQDEKNVQQKVKVNPQRRRALEKDW